MLYSAGRLAKWIRLIVTVENRPDTFFYKLHDDEKLKTTTHLSIFGLNLNICGRCCLDIILLQSESICHVNPGYFEAFLRETGFISCLVSRIGFSVGRCGLLGLRRKIRSSEIINLTESFPTLGGTLLCTWPSFTPLPLFLEQSLAFYSEFSLDENVLNCALTCSKITALSVMQWCNTRWEWFCAFNSPAVRVIIFR